MNEENEIIRDTIDFFENGKFHDKKEKLKEAYEDGTKVGNYIVQKVTWCWLIWKYIDDPAYKGEPLVKIIPETVEIENIPAVLNAQPWTYI